MSTRSKSTSSKAGRTSAVSRPINTPSALYAAALAEVQRKNPNVSRALTKLRAAAKEGSADASYALATWYLHGNEPHVKKNIREATRLLRLGVEGKVPAAMFDLAVSYESGIGVKGNPQKAFFLYTAAAIRGHEQAIFEVGRCIRYGIGTTADRRAAAIWFKRAKELNVYETD